MAAGKRQATGAGEPRRACGCAAGAALRSSLPTLPSPLSSLPSSRRAFTLIEMLVVISILVLLAAVTVPNIRPALESRRVRETARSVESYLNRARVDAIERGLPVGIEFVRAGLQTEACVQLRQVVAQPIYTGEDNSAVVSVQIVSGVITLTSNADAFGTGKVQQYDLIQLGSRAWNPAAPTYRIDSLSIDTTSHVATLKVTLISQGAAVPWPASPSYSTAQPFAVYRRPTVSTAMTGAVGPLQLPESMCIDLYESGTDTLSFPTASTSVVVMFGPNGTVKEILNAGAMVPVERLYLLIGRRDRLPASVASPRGPSQHEDGLRNWEDLNNLWVSIVPRTGMTVTTENARYSQPSGFDYTDSGQRQAALRAARGLAQTAQNMGGR